MSPLNVVETHTQVSRGVGAQTILSILVPLVESRKNFLLDELGRTPPDLALLLDIRAKLTEVRRIQKELERVRDQGVDAAQALRVIAGE